MAYENDVLTRDSNDDLALRVVQSSGDNPASAYDDVYTRDSNGKLAVRVVGAGGGGGDSHNLGWYATPQALNEAHATAEAGDWAIVGSTDTVWVWDTDTSAWVDTDTKGEVTVDMIIVKSATMPTASTVPAGAVYQYVGATNATYTHGYIYENVATTTYNDSVTFSPATISGTVVTATAGSLATLAARFIQGDITEITNGTMTYDQSGELWVFVGKDADDNTVGTFQIYQLDYEDAGFTFTGTPADGDVVAFTCTITASSTYAWTRIDVQPAGSQSTYMPYPAGWTTNSTTKAFCDDIAADTTATVGKAYLGEVTLNDMPSGIGNAEVKVEIMDGTTAATKVIVLTMSSGNVAPYMWQYVYWNEGVNVSGWKGFQEQLVSGTNIKTINNTSILGSGNITVDSLPAQSGQSGKYLTTDGSAASWGSISFPVTSVNSKTGAVTLTASDVGALPDSTVIPAAQVNSDWNASSGVAEILNKPSLATVATSGSYADLTNKPTIPAAQVNSDWNASSGVAEILNKPTLAAVATSGAYADLSGTPTIPTKAADVDAVPQLDTLPTAGVDYLGQVVQFVGTTGTYTNGYFYECVSDGQSTPTYSWTQKAVQPSSGGLPSQTGNAGKFLTTDGTDASWGTQTQSDWNQTNSSAVDYIKNKPAVSTSSGNVLVGSSASGSGISLGSAQSGMYGISIGSGSQASNYSIAIGYQARVGSVAAGAIAIGACNGVTVTEPDTFNIVKGNNIYKMMDANGTIPTDRFTTTPSADGTYVPTLTISSGVASRSWTAPGGGGSVPTLTWYTVSTAGNTLTIADTSSAQLVKIYKNGLLLQPTEDYTISGTTLTTVGALVVGDKITTEIF